MNKNTTQEAEKEWLSPDEYADKVGIHRNTVLSLIRSGELVAKKHGRQWRIHYPSVLRELEKPRASQEEQ